MSTTNNGQTNRSTFHQRRSRNQTEEGTNKIEIKSLKRGFAILELFSDTKREITVSEAARALNMHPGAVRRAILTLEAAGLLMRSITGSRYYLGPKIGYLASIYLEQVDLAKIALPYLEELSVKTEETTAIWVIKNDERVCIAAQESPRDLRWIIKIGTQDTFFTGAPGKLLLASMTDDKISELIQKKGLTRYTEHTITDVEDLRKQIEKIRREEIAFSHGERIEFVAAVAVPIRNHKDSVVAAISVTGLATRFNPESNAIVTSLKETAHQISRALGHIGRTSNDRL